MSNDTLNTDKEGEKRRSAEAAIDHVEDGMIIGVGTGSTVAYFIEALGRIQSRIEGAVSSSEQSTAKLKALGIPVLDAAEVSELSVYIDGADEIDWGSGPRRVADAQTRYFTDHGFRHVQTLRFRTNPRHGWDDQFTELLFQR